MANKLITREDIVRGKQNFEAFDQYLDGGADEQVRLPSGKSIKTRAGVEKELTDKFPSSKAGLRDVGVNPGQVAVMTSEGLGNTGLGAPQSRLLLSENKFIKDLPTNGFYSYSNAVASKLTDAPINSVGASIINLKHSPSFASQLVFPLYAHTPNIYFRNISNLGDSGESVSDWFDIYHSGNKKPYQTTTADPANLVVTGTGELQRTTSSKVFKDRIKNLDIDDYRKLLKAVQPVSYHSKNTSDDPDRIWYSFIAEDLVEVDPHLVQLSPIEFYEDTDEEGNTFVNSRELPEGKLAPSGLNLNGIITMLTRINQYMLDDIEALEAEKTQLKSRMTKLENRLESLEKKFASE